MKTYLVRYAGRMLSFQHEGPDHIGRYHADGFLYERRMIDHLRSLPEVRGRWAVDVGAHVGNHSAALLAGGEVAGVIAIEPTERWHALCHALRHVDPMGERRLAIRAVVGNGETVRMVDAPAGNTGMARVEAAETGTVTKRLDELVPVADVGLVKVDVEGHELRVLEGARALLERCKPTLAIEGDLATLAAVLEPLGYEWTSTFNATPTHVFRHREVM